MTEANASRTSALSLLSLLAGLCAVAMVLGGLCGVWVTERLEIFLHPTLESAKVGFWSARIVAVCAAAPALLALILWGAAGAAVRESEGELRGMALYRTGFVLALASACGAYFIQAKAAEEWNRARAHAPPDASISWEEQKELMERSQAMRSQLREKDARGFASHYLPEFASRVERWVADEAVTFTETTPGWGRLYRVDDATRYPKGTVEFKNIPLKNFRKDDVIVVDYSAWAIRFEEKPVKGYTYFVFRRVGGEWKVVAPIPE